VRRGLATVIRRLGGPGASMRAARVAVELMDSKMSRGDKTCLLD